jgi:hypothetical protein
LFQFDHFDLFFFQNAPSHISFFLKKKKSKKKKKERRNMLGWPNHPHLDFFFFLKNKICDGGILGKKKVKVVKLQQFESFFFFGGGGGRELSVTFETLEVKVQMSG